jgi:hypothetical protein
MVKNRSFFDHFQYFLTKNAIFLWQMVFLLHFCGNFCGKKKPLLNPFFITFFLKKSIYISILPQCHKVFKSCRNSDLNIGKSFWFVAMWFCVRTFTNLPELSRVVNEW